MNRETVLPLEPREKKKFAKPTSFRLLQLEKIRMTRSICLLSLTSIKIISFVILDYSLFWVLITIYEAGYNELQEVERPEFRLHVEGEGIIADFYRNLGKTFRVPENPEEHLNPLHCLPDPKAPDMKRNVQIAFFLLVCWICTLTEAYGLRLRHMVMSEYYPDRARERAVWLYNHILYSRASFVKYARKHIKRNFQQGDSKPSAGSTEQKDLDQKFASFFSGIPILGHYLLRYKRNMCSLCGKLGTKNEPLKCCPRPKCPGKYCLDCFVYLRNLCMTCQNIIEFEDDLDLSEEVDSSEEEIYRRKRCEYLDRVAEKNKFKIIRDILACEKLKDPEETKTKDYAKLSDLGSHKETVRRRLKEAIIKRLQTLAAKNKEPESPSKNKVNGRLKRKVQDLIKILKQNKSQSLMPEFEKAVSQELVETKPEKSKENLEGGQSKKKKRKLSVNISAPAFIEKTKSFPVPLSKADYEELKDEVKERIKLLTKQKNLKIKDTYRASKSEQTIALRDKLSVSDEQETRKGKSSEVEVLALSVQCQEGGDSKEELIDAESNESLFEFWKESSEIEASRCFAKFQRGKNVVKGQVDESLLEYWKQNANIKPSSLSLESRWVKSESSDRCRYEATSGESSVALNNFTYYFIQKEKNVDIYMVGAPQAEGVLDVNVRTFVGEEYQEGDNGNIIL